ncbi:MAG: BREX-1 system adenine-specific DNA-methyltransferase PglX, partial [Erysipelotrichia bacterium]|nr:BREX-1 system adenine-specific DNA-methyltransferase PglX [Erysipelotrichia bacterium]
IIQLKHENRLDELFRMLFIKQCNQLGDILPELFEKTNDYTELLLSINFTDSDGIVSHLVNDIDEADFAEAVEIIGWMYQYYNEDRKNQIINIYKGTIKKDDIPAATQLFTTDWVVRYMVDNSLGRYWIERNPQSKLKDKLEYFVTPKDGVISNINQKISPEELTFFDPCMGSGHILVYAFDVLMEIYRECGYLDREAAQAIINNNLFGLDIDDRAYQLAYFALMMKARSYDRKFFGRNIQPEIASVSETNILSKFTCDGVTEDEHKNEIGEYLVSIYKDAKELGSLISVSKHDYDAFAEYLKNSDLKGQLTIDSDNWKRNTMPLMKKVAKQASIMSGKYTVVCTNPPYMNKMEGQLKRFVTENYKPYSGDLFSVFIYRNFEYCKPDGYSAFMTPFVWMFIKTYEQLREYIINNKSITTLVQMEYSAFEEATVPICTFVLRNSREDRKGLYFKLSDFKGGMEVQRKKVLEAIYNKDCGYFYETKKENFSKIPGSPIAYWVSEDIVDIFESSKLLSELAIPKQGIATSNNDIFLRIWFECNNNDVFLECKTHEESSGSNCKWYPYNKGGEYRKWYGNNDYVVNWQYDGRDLKAFKGAVLRNTNFYFKECISWSLISSSSIAFRYKPSGHLFDVAGMSCFKSGEVSLWYLLGLNNSKLINEFMSILAPTINYQVGNIANIPVIVNDSELNYVEELVKTNISISKTDWDSFETSWDFKRHPLLKYPVIFDTDTKEKEGS